MTKNSLILISTASLLGLADLERDMAWDLSPELARHGIDRSMLDNSDGLVRLASVIDLLEDCAANYGFPQLGLEIARRRPSQAFAVITYLLKFSPTVGYAISHGNKFASLLHPGRTWVTEEQGESITLTRIDHSGYSGNMDQLISLAMAQYFKLIKSLCGPDWQAESISFTFSPKGKKKLYMNYFGAPVHFNSDANSIQFPRHFLHRKISSHDAGMLAIIEAHIESLAAMVPVTIKEQVEFLINLLISSSECNLKSVSQRLGLHSKALQRKLQEENTTFREIHLEARMTHAANYLQSSTLQVNHIAELLGYSCSPAFSRSFKNQFGLSPEDWRSRHAQVN